MSSRSTLGLVLAEIELREASSSEWPGSALAEVSGSNEYSVAAGERV